jgi:aminoglycoside phosphotransferase (APT) family kinase protein
MAIENVPAAEVRIDEALIRALLHAQHPDLADRPLRIVAEGWDNVLARLGDDLVVRLPRRALAAGLIEHEQRWLPALAARLPLPVPVPVRTGVAGAGFPWSWSVCRWFEGANAAIAPPADPARAVASLVAFLAALHRCAPFDAPANAFRGVPLAARDTNVRRYLAAAGPVIDQAAARRCWDAACALPPYDGPSLWVHGDLHPGNIVVRGGAIAAIVDFGDVTAGDPAVDHAVAWMLFAPAERARFRAALGVDDVAWRRAAGNALAHGLACLAGSADAAPIAAVGRRTLDAVLGDPDLA